MPLVINETGGAQPTGLQWSVTYPAADITGVTATVGTAAAGKTITCNGIAGKTTCVLYGTDAAVLLNGTVANLSFSVSGTASDAQIPVGLSLMATSGDGSAIAASGTGNTLTVSASVALNSLSCNPTSLSGPATASCQVTLTGAAPSALIVSLNSSSAAVTVPGSVAINAGSSSASFTATANQVTSAQTSTLTASLSGQSRTVVITDTPPGQPTTYSVWNTATVPATITENDSNAVELGMKFRTTQAGLINALRFYKGPQNTGTHTGHVWTSAGTLLGTVTFANETASGWQTAKFAAPISVQANTTYIVSYYAPGGYYSADSGYFTKSVTSGPLTALQDGTDGGNGVYRYGSDAFPNQTYKSSNYWIDLVFQPGSTTPTSPTTGPNTSIWTASTIPSNTAADDGSAVELGVKFRSDVAGQVNGLRFYKGAGNTGPHQGNLWSSSGALLATVTFTNETAGGWQEATFSTPVAIQPNTTYIVSYYAPAGHYAFDGNYFQKATDAAPLHALADGTDGPNGLFLYGTDAFPTQSYQASNYWVDVLFAPSATAAAGTRP